ERRAIGNLYAGLSAAATAQIEITSPPPASVQSAQAYAWIVSPGQDHSIQRERYRLLLSQAERIRLCVLALGRLRIRIEREAEGLPQSKILVRVLEMSSALLGHIAQSLLASERLQSATQKLNELSTLSEEMRRSKHPALSPLAAAMVRDAITQMDALAGQLRAAIDLAASATPSGLDAFEQREASKPWSLRVSGTVATIRANLSFESAACRHAVRLAACLALGDSIGRALEWRRAYWIPMTIAIVLKPDFQSTFSRGVLRLAGTFAGLAFATALSHLLSPLLWVQMVLVAMFVFILRCFGPANYGIFVAAVSALVVSLVAITGVAPSQVIAARALNTCAGGALALLVYWIWPTWERTQVADVMARMLDGYRAYFRAVSQAYLQPEASFESELNRTRQDARLARSNLEASVDRLSAEPGGSGQLASAFTAMLASSHRLVHALMALEANLSRARSIAEPEPFRRFANDVEMSLYLLGAVLRGSPIVSGDLPDLREAHHNLIQASGSPAERFLLLNVETDRITNSLNTLREQVFA
ncbi:MAG: FUSC family protein, partial [Nitrospirota bacterium]